MCLHPCSAQDVLNRSPEARYALAPAYAIAATSLATLPRAELPPLSAAGFCLAAALATVPAGLLDFRYFTQPVVTALLLVRFTRKQLILMVRVGLAATATGARGAPRFPAFRCLLAVAIPRGRHRAASTR